MDEGDLVRRWQEIARPTEAGGDDLFVPYAGDEQANVSPTAAARPEHPVPFQQSFMRQCAMRHTSLARSLLTDVTLQMRPGR